MPVFGDSGMQQSELSQSNHKNLVRFILDIQVDQNLRIDTAIAAIELMDFVLAEVFLPKREAIVHASACMSLMCKFEEIYVSDRISYLLLTS